MLHLFKAILVHLTDKGECFSHLAYMPGFAQDLLQAAVVYLNAF